uniref:Uncharacterized protein n=1 Tax=viral metagenome TaxID=1070528 RepID=A0A6C0JE31_9ZZZZ
MKFEILCKQLFQYLSENNLERKIYKSNDNFIYIKIGNIPKEDNNIPCTNTVNICKRNGTLAYESIKCIGKNLNPKFTKADKIKKNKIFDIENQKKCIFTNKSVCRGDHIFGIRENFKTIGRYGIDDQWNLLPVYHSLQILKKNSFCYKNFKFKDKDNNVYYKNISYENLTDEEIKNLKIEKVEYDSKDFDVDTKLFYTRLLEWKEYIKLRNAQLYFSLTQEQTEKINSASILCDDIIQTICDEINTNCRNEE